MTYGYFFALLESGLTYREAWRVMAKNKTAQIYQQATKKVKDEVRQRDGLICQYCGKEKKPADNDRSFVVEHILSSIVYGPSLPFNLVVACQKCNMKKRGIWIPNNIGVLMRINRVYAEMICRYGNKQEANQEHE